jgi:cold shock CspA family protein
VTVPDSSRGPVPAGTGQRFSGTVVAFDADVGWGELEISDDQPRRFGFHCTQIWDDSRRIATGTRVTFAVVAGRGGRWEAARLRPA